MTLACLQGANGFYFATQNVRHVMFLFHKYIFVNTKKPTSFPYGLSNEHQNCKNGYILYMLLGISVSAVLTLTRTLVLAPRLLRPITNIILPNLRLTGLHKYFNESFLLN